MAQSGNVLLLDDGELDDVQEILENLDIPYGRVRGGAIADGTPPPSQLLVATSRRIRCVDFSPKPDAATSAADASPAPTPVRVVVVDEDSPTLRAQLRTIGFDYLVRRPVHGEAMRLLLLHCLYAGVEKRGELRIPLGFDVSIRTGLLPRRATLADLSSSGCRLLSPYALEPGMRIKVDVPTGNENAETLSLTGRVLRIHLDERLQGDGLYSTAVVFDGADATMSRRLEETLRMRAGARITEAGSLAFERQGLDLAELPSEPPAESDGKERRQNPRASYQGTIAAFGNPALHVLVGRDLSTGGMRVHSHPELELGDRLHLALYGEACDEPISVFATVSRDDGDCGLGLVFDPLDDAACLELEKLVANLPSVESLHDGEAGAMGTVMSKILDD